MFYIKYSVFEIVINPVTTDSNDQVALISHAPADFMLPANNIRI